jgi:DNA repair protein RecN (Recombination protein N)
MLQKLHIQNYAIIDELEIVFSSGLNIITGETGAGKSILMGALSLILGGRADNSALLNRDKKCMVEAFFHVADQKAVRRFLKEQELDAEDELIVRREIAISGKSRAFINDTPVNLEQLRSLSDHLADLHRQFDTLELGESDFQREVLDALATNTERLSRYQQTYRQWQEEKLALEALQWQQQQFDKEADYNQYLYDELAEAGFAENELEEAEQELRMLGHSEGQCFCRPAGRRSTFDTAIESHRTTTAGLYGLS